jgi:hypothetical protein
LISSGVMAKAGRLRTSGAAIAATPPASRLRRLGPELRPELDPEFGFRLFIGFSLVA